MSQRQVNHLSVPPMDLTISDAGPGKLRVELEVPRSVGSIENTPFLEVTRNEQAALLNGARQDVLAKLSKSGFQLGDIKYEYSAEHKQNGGVGADVKVPKIGKVYFDISSELQQGGKASTTLHSNPDIAGAIREAEKNFDTRRQDIYEARAKEWHRAGGTTLESYNDRTKKMDVYKISPEAAKDYVNERHPFDIIKPGPFKKGISSAGDEGAIHIADASPVLVPGNDRVNRQFEQALKGAGGDKDAAAVAVDTISKVAGYKPDQDVAVLQGKNGQLVASQGQGDAALNVLVPQAKQGDFERVAAQMTAQPQQAQQIAMQPESQTRNTPTV